MPRARIRPFALIALALCAATLVLLATLSGKVPLGHQDADNGPDVSLEATFIDVGQGDAALLLLPDGSALLVDGGQRSEGDAVAQAVRALGDDHPCRVLATHPHADHIGGLIDVLGQTNVMEVWEPSVRAPTATAQEFEAAIGSSGCPVRVAAAGTVIVEGPGFCARLLWPPGDADFEDLNDWSAILLVTCADKTLLMTGDARADIIAQACLEAGVSHVDALKVAHHGSETGTTQDLVRELSPQVAVVSSGLDNPYGHPDQLALDALAGVGTRVYGTAANGEVRMVLDASGIDVETEREGVVAAGDAWPMVEE